MHPAALRSTLAKLGWTIAAGGIGGVTASPLVDALSLPGSYKPVALIVVSGVLVTIKNIIAAHTGDPTTTKFDGPLRLGPQPPPLFTRPDPEEANAADAAVLQDRMLTLYATDPRVETVANPSDLALPHGKNSPGETDA